MIRTRVFPYEQVNQPVLPEGLPARFTNGNYDHAVVSLDGCGTVVLDTPFGVITVAVIPHSVNGSGENGGCLDIKYHGDYFQPRMLGFNNNGSFELPHDCDLFSFDLGKRY